MEEATPRAEREASSPSASSSGSSSSGTSRSSTPAKKKRSSKLRSFLGLKSHTSSSSSSHPSSDDEDEAGDLPASTLPMYGYLGPHLDVDGHPTHTSNEQLETERRVDVIVQEWKQPLPVPFSHRPSTPSVSLLRDAHVAYLLRSMELLPAGYASLDASRPWLVYWSLQSLSALGYPLPLPLAQRCAHFLSLCQHPTGGYGGGPGQFPHLAPTYAAINALCLLSGVEGVGAAVFGQVERRRLYGFLERMKRPDGGFAVCDDGECDTRGVYTAVSVATMCGLMSERLQRGLVEYLQRCQTFEGGMGAEPGNEAHGGYTFCSLAALMMLGKQSAVRLEGSRGVRQWAARRQRRREGGFCGRTNKLVDGCYSFWVGALFPLLDMTSPGSHSAATSGSGYDELALQRYILLGGQSLTGGLRDKPGKVRRRSEHNSCTEYHTTACSSAPEHSLIDAPLLCSSLCCANVQGADLYHTCYCLSGLGVAQWGGKGQLHGTGAVIGGDANRVRRMNPLYNVPIEDAERGLEWFARCDLPVPSWSLP